MSAGYGRRFQHGNSDGIAVLKLSTKCRRLEQQKWELVKKFPFLRRLYVKRGLPSPLHDHPMQIETLPHRFVCGLQHGNSDGIAVLFFFLSM